jgi:[CysO sulfur-carrier protein]-S-L-cysteine hydrolase
MGITTIALTAAQLAQLASLAKNSLPSESCAFLLGKGDRVVEVLPMRNADESAVTFSIEPSELLQAYDLAESKKLQVIGIFHSHPAKPAPSSTDKKFMEINPVVWLIYSTTEGQFKAYLYDDTVKEVAVKIKG